MKQIIVINESLNLMRGKLAAQVAHASIASFLSAGSEAQKEWLECGMPKIVLSAASEADLLSYYKQALEVGLPVELIRDAGRTAVPSGTLTCIGIGPAKGSQVDQVTGNLRLVK